MEKTNGKDMYDGARCSTGQLFSECSDKDIQREGERIVASYLERRGYELIDTDWECPFGHAIVASKEGDEQDSTGGGIAIVEVDTRLRFGADEYSMPDLDVDEDRTRRLKSMALWCLATMSELPSVRADVVAIDIIADHTARVRHLVSAYYLEG